MDNKKCETCNRTNDCTLKHIEPALCTYQPKLKPELTCETCGDVTCPACGNPVMHPSTGKCWAKNPIHSTPEQPNKSIYTNGMSVPVLNLSTNPESTVLPDEEIHTKLASLIRIYEAALRDISKEEQSTQRLMVREELERFTLIKKIVKIVDAHTRRSAARELKALIKTDWSHSEMKYAISKEDFDRLIERWEAK